MNKFIIKMTLALVFTSTTSYVLAEKIEASAAKVETGNLGEFEASGARIGMSYPFALEVISETKSAWAPMIASQKTQAIRDCAQSGRSFIYLAMSKGYLSASLDAVCEMSHSEHEEAKLRQLTIKTKLSPEFSIADVSAELKARYGESYKTETLENGGFEMTWLSHSKLNFGPQKEMLVAHLEVRPMISDQNILTLKLSSSSLNSAQDLTKNKAKETLPF